MAHLVRSVNDGQLGTVVQHEGRTMVRLDRGKTEQHLPYVASMWMAVERQSLQPMQVARVCYEADRALRISRGTYGISDWQTLKQPDQIAWLNPPSKGDERAELYAAIRKALA